MAILTIVLNIIGLLVFIKYAWESFSPYYAARRQFTIPGVTGQKYEVSEGMMFLLVVTITAPMFLPQISLLKYLVFYTIALYYLLDRRYNCLMRGGPVVMIYLLFSVWLIIASIYSPHKFFAFRNLIKYSIPILALFVGYNALKTKEDFVILLKCLCYTGLFFSFWTGGFAANFLHFITYSPFGWGVFSHYAAISDFFVVVIPAAIILGMMTGNKWWYLLAFWLTLSHVFYAVRTGLGGTFVSLAVLALYKYRFKSIPILVALLFAAAAVIVYVPAVNEKFFNGEFEGEYTVEDIATGKVGLDNMQTNSREYMWTRAMADLYDGHELTGSGLGSVAAGMEAHKYHPMLKLIHGDYVQLLCDTGLIGLWLFIAFVAAVALTIWIFGRRKNGEYTMYSGWLAASTLGGVLFCMGFDNVVSLSMIAMIFPFMFIGFFLKFKDLYAYADEAEFTAAIPDEEIEESEEIEDSDEFQRERGDIVVVRQTEEDPIQRPMDFEP